MGCLRRHAPVGSALHGMDVHAAERKASIPPLGHLDLDNCLHRLL